MVIKNFLTLKSAVPQIERSARWLTSSVVSSKPAHGIWNIGREVSDGGALQK